MASETKQFQSSWLDSGEYDPDQKTLVIIKSNGDQYTLTGVDPQTWDGFKNAWSPGRFFDQFLKGQY